MRLWDLDGELLFPRQAVVAYVKNLLQLSGSRVQVRALVSSTGGYHRLDAVARDGQDVQLVAPFAVGGTRRMYIPFVLQRSLGNPSDYHWSSDGKRTRGCMRIACQAIGSEFWLMTCRSAVVLYARAGKPPASPSEAARHPSQVEEFIEKALAEPGIEETFRFADQEGRTRIVPFLPLVINHGIAMEKRDARPALPDYAKENGPGRRF